MPRDTGSVLGVRNPDGIQKTVRTECDEVYPPINWRSRVYENDGKPCVRVEVEYSGETPHFGSPSWIRRDSVTTKATDEVFQRLIEFRLSKVRELALWIGKSVTVEGDIGKVSFQERTMSGHPRWKGMVPVKLLSVNNFFATFEHRDGQKRSEPLEKLIITWDDKANCLKLLVEP